jgi:hypothetical protein
MAETRDTPAAEWGTGRSAGRFAWALLAAHSPVTLLMDLARPDGPGSQRLLLDEGMPDGDWVPDLCGNG